MATRYADRAFLSINGSRLVDVQSASLRHNKNARAVSTMSRDGFNRGFVQGNSEIDLTFTIAVDNSNARPKLENINYEVNDVQLTFVIGADQFVCTGLFFKDLDDNAGGVGDEVKTTFNMSALRVTDAIGNSTLFDIQLS